MENKKNILEELKNASPLESAKLLQDIELYDAKSSREIIDEVYEQFATGENMKDEILKPVFLSVVDGLLEATSGGRAARKKGLTASRVLTECENFSYSNEQNVGAFNNGFVEYKNAEHEFNEYQIKLLNWEKSGKKGNKPIYTGSINPEMTEKFIRGNYEDKKAMNDYKDKKFSPEEIGDNKNAMDEYTGEKNITLEKKNPDNRRNDEKHKYTAETDHIIPLKELHEKYKTNYGLTDDDIKRIANSEKNLAITASYINGSGNKDKNKEHNGKGDMTNTEFVESVEKGTNKVELTETAKKNLLAKEKEATEAIEKQVNDTVMENLLGFGQTSESELKKIYEGKKKELGRDLTDDEKKKINRDLSKKKQNDILKTGSKEAVNQAKDNAVGNLILFIVKPVYYEMSDIFKNGLADGVGADSGVEAIVIRFGRIKNYVFANAKAFIGDNLWDFVKGFVSSLVEGIIGLFVGVFKQILKILKEGIKIFVQSAKILFGKEAKNMSPAEKGDAIIKLLGGSIIAIAGIGIEALINKIGIGEPWSVVLATMLSGIASALFMYVLDKADLFSVKAEKRRDRILEIFDERIKDIQEAEKQLDTFALETLKEQREEFENINNDILEGFNNNNIEAINAGLYRIAKFMKVELPYSNTDEFIEYSDSRPLIQL